MYCQFCNEKTELLFENGEAICLFCAVKKGYTVCTETGKYKSFVCNNICSECKEK